MSVQLLEMVQIYMIKDYNKFLLFMESRCLNKFFRASWQIMSMYHVCTTYHQILLTHTHCITKKTLDDWLSYIIHWRLVEFDIKKKNILNQEVPGYWLTISGISLLCMFMALGFSWFPIFNPETKNKTHYIHKNLAMIFLEATFFLNKEIVHCIVAKRWK